MEKIKNKIKEIFYFINESRYITKKEKVVDKCSNIKIENALKKNCELNKITYIKLPEENNFKWVGAVNYHNNMYCITNKTDKVLKLDLENEKVTYLEGNLKTSNDFKWTGGCIYQDKIYGFPRASNQLLCINPKTDEITTIDLNLNYNEEHHYGGVCTKEGYIYQPPRKNNKILVINLNDYSTHEIKIAPDFLHYSYLTGIQHSNGLIYFFPEKREKVLVLNPVNEQFYFIGDRMNCMVFDAAIGEDNNIYGFSGYERGILKIDTKNNNAKMICKEIGIPGCYGSKLGINGKIYGVPGNGKYFWEFDVEKQTAQRVFEIEEDIKAKCAGGIVAKNGTIYTVPALGNKIYKIEFNNTTNLTQEELESMYFSDNY